MSAAQKLAALEAQLSTLSACMVAVEHFTAAMVALEARVVALEAQAAATKVDGLVPLAHEVQRAHARLDKAAEAFRSIAPKREQPRITPAQWARALDDLRAEAEEAGSDKRFFDRTDVLARHRVLETMVANRQAAGA